MSGRNPSKQKFPNGENSLIGSDKIRRKYLQFISNEVHEIFCPFITSEVAEQIIRKSANITRIITRWKLSDFRDGYADLKLFYLCQENNIDLYINPKVHLKATLRNREFIFNSSANLTRKGLNFVSDDSHNYELSSIINVKGIQDLIYLEKIVQDSIYVNENVFEEIKERVENLENNIISEPEEFSYMEDKAYYISQLPQTSSPALLYEYYSDNVANYSEEDHNCAIHDLSIYDVPENLEHDSFKDELAKSFFNHPFISGLIDEVKNDGYIYFGRVKQWIQNNCLDVPVPKRRELTGKTQVLYKWIEELGEGNFEVDRPNHSQRIRIIKK